MRWGAQVMNVFVERSLPDGTARPWLGSGSSVDFLSL